MVKALWLTSWYPNKLDAMNGDFIQRHARATALFCNVHVIHLEADGQNALTSNTDVTITKQGNLVEEIILYKLFAKLPFVGKALGYRRYMSLFKKHINAYIQQYGKPQIVHVHVPIKAGILALWLKRKYGIPYVVTEHWAIYNNDAPDAFNKRNYLFRRATKKILQNANLFTPVSAELGKAVQDIVVNIPFTVVPNVVDTTLFNVDGLSQKSNQKFTFLHVSTLSYQKNPEGILRAYKQFLKVQPQSKLIMVGGAEATLIDYAASLNIPKENIQFTGLIKYDEVAALMKISDALVMFSRYENLPCVITEALCCGLPVISSDTGGIKEVINSATGLLVQPQNEDGLLNEMTRMYEERDNFSRLQIAETAIRAFSYQTIGQMINQLYLRYV